MKFAAFMSGAFGRGLRIVAGAALIILAIVIGSVPGIVLGVVGAIFVAAGAFNLCLIAPLLRLPVAGAKIRARAASGV